VVIYVTGRLKLAIFVWMLIPFLTYFIIILGAWEDDYLLADVVVLM